MRIEWLYEAHAEYRERLSYYRNTVGILAAGKFSEDIVSSVSRLAEFPEMGVLKEGKLLGRHGFGALFIGKYVCIYRVEEDAVRIFHLADARSKYI